jgi:hypothetical protein
VDSILDDGAHRRASRNPGGDCRSSGEGDKKQYRFVFHRHVSLRSAKAMKEILMLWDLVTVLALFVLLVAFLWIVVSKWLR